MLSLFPSLFTYQLFVPLLLRGTLGAVLLLWGYQGLRAKGSPHDTLLGIVDALCGVLLIIGLFTQFAALVALVVLGAKLIQKMISKSLFTDGVNYYFILFIIALCLLFTGAGFLAIDLPL